MKSNWNVKISLCTPLNQFSWLERCIDLVLNKWLCSHRPVCAYANASEMLFAPIQHVSMCAQRAHRPRAGSKGKKPLISFFVQWSQSDLIQQNVLALLEPYCPQKPTAEGLAAVQPINEPVRHSIGGWISRSCAVAIPLWSQRKDQVWHQWLFPQVGRQRI